MRQGILLILISVVGLGCSAGERTSASTDKPSRDGWIAESETDPMTDERTVTLTFNAEEHELMIFKQVGCRTIEGYFDFLGLADKYDRLEGDEYKSVLIRMDGGQATNLRVLGYHVFSDLMDDIRGRRLSFPEVNDFARKIKGSSSLLVQYDLNYKDKAVARFKYQNADKAFQALAGACN